MKILFVGDIVGRAGRVVLKERLAEVQEKNGIDFTIVNVENAAGGFGITPTLADEIRNYGVDVMTSGNHIWDKKEILEYFSGQPRLLRPGNYPPGNPGAYKFVGETPAGVGVAVINLQGRVFMPNIDCPFQMAEREIPKLARETPVIVVDFHAEATSEKVAFGWFLDGKVSAVIGTHTHIPTADERVLPRGTAYITDVGMTASYDSVIGMKTEIALQRFITGLPSRLEAETEPARFSSVILDIDESSGRARSIHRLRI
ncbi:MAG: TIGR00282 family metallophosphoesterase [Acidobacteriota bacterium]